MTKKISLLFLICLFSALNINAEVYSGVCGDNVSYTLDTETGVLKITGTGAMKDSYCYDTPYGVVSSVPWYSQRSYIQTVKIADGVTSIGECAFYGCSNLTSITIPNSVTSIGEDAFESCESLTSVIIPNSVTSIGGTAFVFCYSLKEVYCDANNVPFTTSKAFSYFNISNATLYVPKASVAAYQAASPWKGFGKIKSIDDVRCGENVYYFLDTNTGVLKITGTGAMKDYYRTSPPSSGQIPAPWVNEKANIKTVDISDGVTSIGNGAFKECSRLTSVTIPNSVTSIGHNAFFECSSLTSIIIPNSVTCNGEYAFLGCSKLTEVSCNAKNVPNTNTSAFDDSNISNATLYVPITSVATYNAVVPWNNFGTVKDIIQKDIDKSTTTEVHLSSAGTLLEKIDLDKIEDIISLKLTGEINGTDILTIRKMVNLKYLDLQGTYIVNGGKSYYQNYITSKDAIGDYFFKDKEQLIRIILPESITQIKEHAFEGCKSLIDINIPSKVSSIGKDAFYGCNNLISLRIQCPSIGDNWFNMRTLMTVYISNNVVSIGNNAFSGCSGLKSVTIPNSVTSIGQSAFSGCSSLTSITIPNSVTSIGDETFYGCSSLTSVTIPNSVTSIGNGAFKECSRLTSVTIPNSVTSIGEYAFEYCFGLKSVTIGNSVTSIGKYAFYNCSSLTSVHITDIAAWCKIDFASDYFIHYSNPLSYAKHLFMDGKEITDLVIPNSVTSIRDCAFSDCSGLTSVTIPNSVTSIGAWAFYRCSGLSSVTIGNSVTSIGEYAFQGCSGLTSVTIPNSVKSIGESVFSGCSSLTSITIPNSVTSIGEYAFSGCSSLTSITIPNSVTSIGEHAFYNCSSLKSITIPNSVTSIGKYAFYGCSNLFTVNIYSNIVNKIREEHREWSYTQWKITYTYYNLGDIFGQQVIEYVIGNNVWDIGEEAFSGCSELQSVVIGNAVVRIGSKAFSGCTKLTSVVLGNAVRSIRSKAFSGCTKLTSVTSLNTTPPVIEGDTFDEATYKQATLNIQQGCKTIYWLHPYWERFIKMKENEYVLDEIMVVLSTSGFATFYNPNSAYILPNNLYAKVITSESSSGLLYKKLDGEIIPKGVPVILESKNGKGGEYILKSTTDNTLYTEENLLRGSNVQTITSCVNGVSTDGDPNYVYYKLAYGKSNGSNAKTIGWYWGAENGAAFQIQGGKAWLALPKTSQNTRASMLQMNETTSIDNVNYNIKETDSDDIYNIYGSKVNANYKGIIIKGGKKILMK